MLEGISAATHPNFRVRLLWALLLAREGKADAAIAALDAETLKYAGIAMFAPAQLAEVYALAGRPDEALDWLDRAVRNGDERSAWFRRDAFLASIQDQPRFRLILDSIERGRP
jgi:predicted Zn-dependent protease